MKKIFFVLILAAIIATGTAFADHPSGFGIGLQGGYNGSWLGGLGGGGGALTLKLPSLPIFWTVDFALYGSYSWLWLAGDYYLIDQKLVPSIGLNWYFGLGGYVNLGLGDPFGLGVGVRAPIGLSWQPIRLLEIYLQAVPSIGLGILPGVGLGGGWGGNLGIRLWF